jgi:hypothetical protein
VVLGKLTILKSLLCWVLDEKDISKLKVKFDRRVVDSRYNLRIIIFL